MIAKKQIVFYLLVFVLFYILSKAGIYFSKTLNISEDIMILLFGVIFTGLIFLIHKVEYSKDDFFFELTPEKNCQGGPYMYSSDPEKQKYCSQFSANDLAQYNCPAGFHGLPVHWERNDMSDADWTNRICDGNFKDYRDDPQVL